MSRPTSKAFEKFDRSMNKKVEKATGLKRHPAMSKALSNMKLSSKEAANFFKGKGDAGKKLIK